MAENQSPIALSDAPPSRRRGVLAFVVVVLVVALLSAAVAALLVNIFQRKQEAKNPYVKFVEVTETTSDPAEWGKNWPREYDQYKRTVDITQTRYGGSEAMPAQKLDRDPWLKRMFAGYAFSIDYRDRRGHAYMLHDQESTERVIKKSQPGSCLHCHASASPTWRRMGNEALKLQPAGPYDFQWPSVMKGFELMCAMSYSNAHAELLKTPDGSTSLDRVPAKIDIPQGATTQQALAVQSKLGEAHPVSCLDCHDPRTMELRVTRPGFVIGIRELAESKDPVPHLPSIERWREGSRAKPYDPNVDATRQEMRSFVCGQCHVEYYCGPKTTLFFPWGNGLKVEQIEAYYDKTTFPDGTPFIDFKHGETGAKIYKAQHPEFETWSQGTHARAGVACADCHMPYMRQGAMKVSDHWVRSPLLMVNRSCQVCHPVPEDELRARVTTIQDRTRHLISTSGAAYVDMLDAIKQARLGGATDAALQPAFDEQRKSQWRLDYVYAENSMGFHAAQETARILAESIDHSRQGQAVAMRIRVEPITSPVALPATKPVEGVTETEKAPPGPYKR